MKKLVEYFLSNSLIVNLITVLILIIGISSIYLLQKEVFPNVNFDTILVRASYPGSSSEDVEKLVTIPIERQVRGVDGIEEVNAMSTESSSIVWIKVDPDYVVKDVLDDVRSAVSTVDDLPGEVDPPTVTEMKNRNRPIVEIPIYGGSEIEVRFAAKRLRDVLERVSGVSKVDLNGYRDEEIKIFVDPNKLNQYQLTMSELANAIKDRNINLSGGKLKTDSEEIIVRTLNEFESVKDIENVVVRSNFSGNKVTVKDVATVQRILDSDAVLTRSNGKKAVFLNLLKRENADVLKVMKELDQVIKDFFKKEKYKHLSYHYTNDMSYYVTRRLGVLTSNGMYGMAMVFICLLLFLNFRTSLLTSMGAPLSFLAAFALLDSFGVTLNLISMFGLILVLGMLVDDAIIVAEHFYQAAEKGLDPKEAARKAALEKIKPVTATIVTTIIAFSSIFFMGGIMGKFLWQIPLVVILCLLASWLECFFILPNHLADFGRVSPSKKERWYAPLIRLYEKSLKTFLKAPTFTCIGFFIVLFLSIKLLGIMPKELFPGDDVRVAALNIKGNVGSNLELTEKVISDIDEMVLKTVRKEELEQTTAWVGKNQGDFGTRSGSHYGAVWIYVTAPDERNRNIDQIMTEVLENAKKLAPEYDVSVKKMAGGPPKGKAVDIELAGDSIEELKKVSKIVKEKLSEIEGVLSPEIDFEYGNDQLIFDVNDGEARRLGLSTKDVALEIRRALAGDELTLIRENEDDIEVQLQLDENSRKNIKSIMDLMILNREGRRIPLSSLVRLKESPGAFLIRRKDGKRTFSVQASLNKSLATPVGVVKLMKPKMEKILEDFPRVSYTFGGENKDTAESMTQLVKAMGISFLGIFFVLVLIFKSLFQPILILATIPMGIIGVAITFYLSGWSLGFMAGLGMIGLLGVVVNDSIVLVDTINEKVNEIKESIYSMEISELIQNVLDASVTRLRPVLLTTLTTVGGLLPIALDEGGDPFLKPMALSFAGGLFFSTVVTLVFVPCGYLFYLKFLRLSKAKFSRS